MRKLAAAMASLAFSLLVAQGCGSGGGSGRAASSVSPGSTASPNSAASSSSPAKSEYLEIQIEEQTTAAGVALLLGQTVGASQGGQAKSLPLRNGISVTATQGAANVILRFDADAAGVRARDAYAEVAVSKALGRTFLDLAQTAMSVASLTSQTPGLAQPWNLFLLAESKTGGTLEVGLAGDSNGVFTLSWRIRSPGRDINAFGPPAAFGPAGDLGATEKVGGTVHFPIDKDTFKVYVNQAYGYNAPLRFSDFALIPHTWLHLTVTADATGKIVSVHFDAILTSGARIFVAEAPASTDVGGRFFDETTARMQEMLDAEARLPGSSKKWGTSFYYVDAAKGVVDVVVKGQGGAFDIAYAVETPVNSVKP